MTILLQLILLIFSVNAKDPLVTNCQDSIKDLQREWEKNGNWEDKNNGLFIASTEEFGKWIWYKDEGDSITLTKASQTEQLRVNFTKSNCEKKLQVIAIPNEFNTNTDESLKKIIAQNNGLIYIWSPQMPLSYRGITSIEAAAKKKNLTVTIFMDSAAKLQSNHQYNTKYLNRTHSFDLKMRDASLHMPALFAYKKGQILNAVKYGFETTEGYEKDIKDVFNF